MDTDESVEVGTTAYDAYTQRVGVVMSVEASRLWLRPVLGGREWIASPEDVRPADRTEELHAKVGEANRRSAGAQW